VVFHRELPAERPWMTRVASRDPQFDLMLTEPFPAYSPDGTLTAVSARPDVDWPTYNFENVGLMVMNADGSGRRFIFNEPGKLALSPSWSPRADVIAFGV